MKKPANGYTLSDITILITSFLRFVYLKECLIGIGQNLPKCKVIVVDDSDINPWRNRSVDEGRYLSPRYLSLSFDSGLCAKRNAGVKACITPLLLMGSDDFDFSTPEAREGIEKMLHAMNKYPQVDVCGGRHGNTPYEGFLEYVPGSHIKETILSANDIKTGRPLRVDLTCNYFLARTNRIVPWDERFKIGGEHVDWFLDMKEAGRIVYYIPGANINQLPADIKKQDKRYADFRARCWDGHRLMKQKRNIKQYIGFGGDIS